MKFIDQVQINPPVSLIKGQIYPFVEMANVDFYARSPKQIAYKEYTSGMKFEQGDTVVARIEPCLQNGKGFYAKELISGFGSTEFIVFRPKDESVDHRFLYYFLQTHNVRKSMIASMTGATGRQRVNNEVFQGLEVEFPPLPIQRRIADILSAYDDLIENNQRQIKLLEEAATRLYKEWFVHLRFPGHETTPIVDGVPEGWKKGKTKEFIKLNYGKAMKAEERKGSAYPVYGSSGIVGYNADYLVEAPVIILGRKGNVGSVFLSFENAWPIDTVYFISSDISPFYVFFDLQTRSFVNSDSAVPGLNRAYVEAMEMICPTDTILDKFDDTIAGVYALREKLNKQVFFLRQARDKLLPKLMSGEIEV